MEKETECIGQLVLSLEEKIIDKMSLLGNTLLNKTPPQRENFITTEEYNNACKNFMISNIEMVKKSKKEIFNNVLDVYNDFLNLKIEQEKEMKIQNDKTNTTIIEAKKDFRNTCIASGVLTIFFPSFFPFIMGYGMSRAGIDILQTKYSISKKEKNNLLVKEIKDIQIPFYDLTYALRGDYHKTNRELDELKERAKNGENIMLELIDIVEPKRIGLENIEGRSLLPTKEEKNKQYIRD